jgi:hypothetical protein
MILRVGTWGIVGLRSLKTRMHPSSRPRDAGVTMSLLGREPLDMANACCRVLYRGPSKEGLRRLRAMDLLLGYVVDGKAKGLLIDNEGSLDAG